MGDDEFILGEQFPYKKWFADKEEKKFAPSDIKKEREESHLVYPWECEEFDPKIWDVNEWF